MRPRQLATAILLSLGGLLALVGCGDNGDTQEMASEVAQEQVAQENPEGSSQVTQVTQTAQAEQSDSNADSASTSGWARPRSVSRSEDSSATADEQRQSATAQQVLTDEENSVLATVLEQLTVAQDLGDEMFSRQVVANEDGTEWIVYIGADDEIVFSELYRADGSLQLLLYRSSDELERVFEYQPDGTTLQSAAFAYANGNPEWWVLFHIDGTTPQAMTRFSESGEILWQVLYAPNGTVEQVTGSFSEK